MRWFTPLRASRSAPPDIRRIVVRGKNLRVRDSGHLRNFYLGRGGSGIIYPGAVPDPGRD